MGFGAGVALPLNGERRTVNGERLGKGEWATVRRIIPRR
jgi:hypothetical protein